MKASMISGRAGFVNVLPDRGREAQLLYWFRVCVAEWSNDIDPRRGVKAEELLIWDKVLGLGTTDPLAGFASVTSNLVVSFYFAKRGFENIARIIKR